MVLIHPALSCRMPAYDAEQHKARHTTVEVLAEVVEAMYTMDLLKPPWNGAVQDSCAIRSPQWLDQVLNRISVTVP